MSSPSIDSRLLVPAIVLLFVLLGLALTVVVGPRVGWLLLIGFMVGAMLIGSPRVVLFVYWGWVVVFPIVSYNFPISAFKWIDEMLFLTLVGVLLLHHIHFRGTHKDTRLLNRSFLALAAILVASAVLNDPPRQVVLHFCLQYLRSFVLFYYALRFLGPKDSRLVVRIMGLTLLLQVALNTGWLLGINPIPNHARNPLDFAMGTLDACNLVAYVAIAVFCLCVAMATGTKRRDVRAFYIGMGILALWEIYLTYSFHAYFLLAICFGVQLVAISRSLGEGLRKALTLAVAGAALFGVISMADLGMPYVEAQLNPYALKHRIEMMVTGPKGRAYRDVVMSAPADMPYPLLGAGPGNFGSMVGRMYRRPLADKYINYLLTAVDVLSETQGFSITSGPNTGFIAIWSELGPAGFILYWGVHVYVLLRVLRQVRQRMYVNPYLRALAEAFVPVMVMWLTISGIVDYNYIPYMHGGVWLWAAMVWRSDRPAAVEAPVAVPGVRPERSPPPLLTRA